MRKPLLAVLALLTLVLSACADGAGVPAGTEPAPSPLITQPAPATVPPTTEPPVATTTQWSDPERVRSITVGGSGSEYAAPVRCIVDIGVTSRRPTVVESSKAAAASARAMMTVLTEGGIDPQDIQTSDFSVGSYYRNYPDIEGYETNVGYRVTMPNTDAVGTVLAAAVEAGGDDVRAWGVRFEAEPAGLLEAAREKAWADAVSRAEALAALAGEPLGELLDAHEKVLVSTTQGMYEGGEGDTASFSIPVSPGVTGVVVLLTVTFAIGG